MEKILLQTIWLPGVAGILCIIFVRVVLPSGIENFIDWLRKAISFLISAHAIYLTIALLKNPNAYIAIGTLSINSLSTMLVLRANPLSILMMLFASIFTLLSILFSAKYRRGEAHNNWYYGLILLTLASANGVFLAGDFFTFFIFWELSTVFLFGLIALGNNEKTSFAAAKTLIILGFAEAGMFFAMLYIWFVKGTLVFSNISLSTDSTTNLILYFLIAASALAKAGAMPFHSWIPTASQGAPTPIMAYLPASTDKLLGIYFLFFISYGLFSINTSIKMTLMVIGVITIIIAVFMAMSQHNWKKLLSYHAVSQVGYMVLGIGTGSAIGILGGIFHMINHAIYKSSLFFCAGAVERETGITELDRLGGLAKKMPILFFANLVAALAISGVIPLNGFISKWLVYRACLDVGQPIMFILAVFGSALTLASFIKVLHSVYMGPLPPELKNVKSPGFSMWLPPLLLSLACIFFGILPGIPLGKLLLPALSNLNPSLMAKLPTGTEFGIFSVRLGSSYWQVGIAAVLLFLGVVIAWLYYAAGKAFKTRKDKAFVGGIEPGTLAGYHIFSNEAMRFPGTGFLNTIKELPILRSVIPGGEEGFFDTYQYFSKIGNALFVRPLQMLHNGVLSSYLSWTIIGIVLIFVALLR